MYLLLVNALAGSNRYKKIERSLKVALNRYKIKFKIIIIDDLNNIKTLLAEHIKSHTQGIVAVGGNGTVASIIDAMAGHPLPLGIIPTSRNNNLAHTLGIKNWRQGVKLLANHQIIDKRLGKIGQHYFVSPLIIAPRRNLLANIFHKPSRLKQFVGSNLAHRFKPAHSIACQFQLDNELEIKCQASSINIHLDDTRKKKLTIKIINLINKKPVISVFRANRCEISSSLNMPILCGNETMANTPATISAISKTVAMMQPKANKV